MNRFPLGFRLARVASVLLLAMVALPLGAVPAPRPVPTMVLIELAGGFDGLNTVVPYADPAYKAARTTLAVPNVIPLDDHLGLHPSLKALMDSWNAGDFAILLGVGYPDPNRSHFRSIAIWDSGSESKQVVETGWLARLLTSAPRSPDLVSDSIILGETHAGPLKGPGMHNLSFDNLDNFLRDATTLDVSPNSTGSAGYIVSVQKDIQAAAQKLTLIKPLIHDPAIPFPDTGLGRSMKTTAQLLIAGAKVPVFKLTLRGFDTHGNQKADMERLLKELGDAVAAFRANLIQAGLWDQVVVTTYSEFGRRVGENGSGGTDHGTANPEFVWGGRVKGGLMGTQPSLTDLDQGDLKSTLDFRVVFRSLATEFWGITDPASLHTAFPTTDGTIDLVKQLAPVM